MPVGVEGRSATASTRRGHCGARVPVRQGTGGARTGLGSRALLEGREEGRERESEGRLRV